MQQKSVAAWTDFKTKVTAKSTTAPRLNLDQIADEIVANVQKRKHTRYLNPWERVALYNQAFPKYPRMDWDKGHIKGNWLLGNFYGRDNDYFGGYPATAFTRLHTMFKADCDVFFHLFAGTMLPIPPNTITFDIKPEITIHRKTKKLIRKNDKGHRRVEVIRPTICADVRNLGYNVKIWRNENKAPKFGDHGSYILRQGRVKAKGKRKYRYWWIVRKYSAAYRKIFSVVDVVYADPPYAGQHDKFGTTPFDKRQVIRDLGVLLPKGAFLCWFDTLYPMFRKDHYRLIGTIEVRIGTNTSIRGWTLWQRR